MKHATWLLAAVRVCDRSRPTPRLPSPWSPLQCTMWDTWLAQERCSWTLGKRARTRSRRPSWPAGVSAATTLFGFGALPHSACRRLCIGHPCWYVAPADSSYQEVGLNLAVAGMRRGEKARIWAGSKYGYGEKGSFSFPTVPPNADLV